MDIHPTPAHNHLAPHAPILEQALFETLDALDTWSQDNDFQATEPDQRVPIVFTILCDHEPTTITLHPEDHDPADWASTPIVGVLAGISKRLARAPRWLVEGVAGYAIAIPYIRDDQPAYAMVAVTRDITRIIGEDLAQFHSLTPIAQALTAMVTAATTTE